MKKLNNKRNSFVAVGLVVLMSLLLSSFASTNMDGTKESTLIPLELPEAKQMFSYEDNLVLNKVKSQEEWKYESLSDEARCLALNIYFEARNQDILGQLAVGLVTINRVLSSKHPNSICEVVWKKKKVKSGAYVAQFSWTWDGKRDTPKEKNSWQFSKIIAESLVAEGTLVNIADFTDGSTHYHTTEVDPFWNKHLTPTIAVGDHIFYASDPVVN